MVKLVAIARKKVKSSRYVAAFAITILVFLFGYIISSEINNIKISQMSDFEQELRTESLGNELLLQMVQKDTCSNINMTTFNLELASYGKRLTYLESIYGSSTPEINNIKNYYSLLEMRHWLLAQDINDKCSENLTTVLYFYTNYGCTDCEDQGLVLTNIHTNYPFFNIYSFEYALENPAIDYLKLKYNIQKNRLPTLVIADKVYYGFQSKDMLIRTMDLEQKLANDKIIHPGLYR